MTDSRFLIVILVIVLFAALYALGGWTIPSVSHRESPFVQPTATDLVLPSPSPSALPSVEGNSPSPFATEHRTSLSPSPVTSTLTPTPSATDRAVRGTTPSPSPGETTGPAPLATGNGVSPAPSATAFEAAVQTPTAEAYAEPGSMYLGLGDRLLFQGKGFAFETRLTTSEEFRDNYDAAYSSIYIDRVMRGNVNLSIHSSTWLGRPNPGEILLRAYNSGTLKKGDELLWENRTTGEALTLLFIGARLAIPTGQFEQFHELPAHLRREIGQEFIDNHPESRAAYLIRNGHMLTIITCDSRPGHMEIRRDGSVAFPEQTGFVFVYY